MRVVFTRSTSVKAFCDPRTDCSVAGRSTPRCSNPFVSMVTASWMPSKKSRVSPVLMPCCTSLKLPTREACPLGKHCSIIVPTKSSVASFCCPFLNNINGFNTVIFTISLSARPSINTSIAFISG